MLAVISTYLGSIILSLQGEVNELRTNYTLLKMQHDQLQASYNQLRINYTIMQMKYNELEMKYTSLANLCLALNQTCVSVMSPLMGYEPIIRPVVYLAQGANMSYAILFLNITNPMDELINITIYAYMEYPISDYLIPIPTEFLIPPKSTISVPSMLLLFNPSHAIYTSIWYDDSEVPFWTWAPHGVSSISDFLHMNFTVMVAYNPSIASVVPINRSMGFTAYYPESPWGVRLYLINPSPNTINISSYEVRAYNGTLLIACRLSPPIIINSTSGVVLTLPTYSDTTYLKLRVVTPLGETERIAPFLSNCTADYEFPSDPSQLPYGYVILNTSMGNLTMILVPVSEGPWPW